MTSEGCFYTVVADVGCLEIHNIIDCVVQLVDETVAVADVYSGGLGDVVVSGMDREHLPDVLGIIVDFGASLVRIESLYADGVTRCLDELDDVFYEHIKELWQSGDEEGILKLVDETLIGG